MSEKIFQLIAKILGVPLSSLNNDSSPENTEGWDSLKGLLLVDELEKENKAIVEELDKEHNE